MSVSGPDHEDEKRDSLYPRTRARGRVQPADRFWRVVPCVHLPRVFCNLFSTCHQPGEEERAKKTIKTENRKEREIYRDWHEETAFTAKVALNQSITKSLNKDMSDCEEKMFLKLSTGGMDKRPCFYRFCVFFSLFLSGKQTQWFLECCCAVFGSFNISESLCCGSVCSLNGSLSVCQCPVSARISQTWLKLTEVLQKDIQCKLLVRSVGLVRF